MDMKTKASPGKYSKSIYTKSRSITKRPLLADSRQKYELTTMVFCLTTVSAGTANNDSRSYRRLKNRSLHVIQFTNTMVWNGMETEWNGRGWNGMAE